MLGSLPTGSDAKTESSLKCSIAIVKPVQLSQLFLVALSWESYHLAQSTPSTLEDLFCSDKHILRQNTTYSFLRESKEFKYRLIMTEPVLQGYASSGNTRFFVSMQDSGSHDSGSSSASESSAESDKEGIEIDESFLAGSVLRSISNHSPAASPRAVTHEDPIRSATYNHDSLTSLTELSFRCIPCNEPIMISTDDHTVYIRTYDLGRVGLLNGEWVREFKTVCGNIH